MGSVSMDVCLSIPITATPRFFSQTRTHGKRKRPSKSNICMHGGGSINREGKSEARVGHRTTSGNVASSNRLGSLNVASFGAIKHVAHVYGVSQVRTL